MSFEEIDNLTIAQYSVLMDALRLRSVDEEYKAAKQAFFNHAARAQRKNGKPAYTRFEKFYNYEKRIKEVIGESGKEESRFKELSKHIKEQRERNN